MSLSKVYKTTETFQPEDIVQRKQHSVPVWESILRPLADSAPQPQERQSGLPDETANSKVTTPSPPDTEEISSANADTSLPDIDNQDTHNDESSPEAEQPITAEQVTPPVEPAGPAPEIIEQMIAESFEKGILEGVKQAEEDYGSAAKSLQLICQQLDQLRETIIQNSVGEMQDLVLVIAEKIIRHSVQEQHSTILDTIEEAIHKAVKSDEFYVFVNPDDFEVVSQKSGELVAGLNGLNNLVIKKDAAVERGGCRVESDNCTVDATIASQLELISNQLKKQH